MKVRTYLLEIKYRVLFTCCCFAINFALLYYYKEQILFLLGQHQTGNFPHFITTNLPEIFLCLFKFSIYLALYCTFPIVLIQSLFFFIPALYRYEYKIIKNLVNMSLLLYIVTNITLYKILLPYCWEFFSGFELNYEESGINVKLETRLYEYLNFFTEFFFSLNIILNLCLILSFVMLKFPVYFLIKLRKIIYLFSFVIATIISPPDITSQIFIGVSFTIIYEFYIYSLLLTSEYKRANNGT